jgi:hypothetical protein
LNALERAVRALAQRLEAQDALLAAMAAERGRHLDG